MALNTQIFHPHKSKQPEKRCKKQQQNEEYATRLHSENKEEPTNQVKTIVIPISIYKNKHKRNTNSRSKKNRECLVQLYEAIITIWWKHLTNHNNQERNKTTSTTLTKEDPPYQT